MQNFGTLKFFLPGTSSLHLQPLVSALESWRATALDADGLRMSYSNEHTHTHTRSGYGRILSYLKKASLRSLGWVPRFALIRFKAFTLDLSAGANRLVYSIFETQLVLKKLGIGFYYPESTVHFSSTAFPSSIFSSVERDSSCCIDSSEGLLLQDGYRPEKASLLLQTS